MFCNNGGGDGVRRMKQQYFIDTKFDHEGFITKIEYRNGYPSWVHVNDGKFSVGLVYSFLKEGMKIEFSANKSGAIYVLREVQ